MLGALHLDVVVRAPRLPALDETLQGQSVDYRFGGKGGNQAVAAARMGARVAMAGRVGTDAFALTLRETLQQAGMIDEQVIAVPGASGMSVATINADGDYGAVIVSGVNQQNTGRDTEVAPSVKVVVLQNEIPEVANTALAARLAPSVFLLLNAAPARDVGVALLKRMDLLVVNRVEAAQMTNAAPDAMQPEVAAKALMKMGPKAVCITLGANGCLLAAQAGVTHFPGHVVAVQDTHGAGDAFVGALAAQTARGTALDKAVGFAQGAAALHVGTQPQARQDITADRVQVFLQDQVARR